ncbi:YgjP-like metallopeptidase domain-containing protein [Magnetospirillum sp. XM-1]
MVHELYHIRHRSLDAEFWQMVGCIIQDWKERMLWLERNENLPEFK